MSLVLLLPLPPYLVPLLCCVVVVLIEGCELFISPLVGATHCLHVHSNQGIQKQMVRGTCSTGTPWGLCMHRTRPASTAHALYLDQAP